MSEQIHADKKYVEETPIEELNKLVRENKLVFVGLKALNAWKLKQKENE